MEINVVDLIFPIAADRAPADHGYGLYGAICRIVPAAHGARWLAIHPLRGSLLVDGSLRLPRHAALTLRLAVEHIPQVLPLAGQTLIVGGRQIFVRQPLLRQLTPCPSLDARMVAIKLTEVPHKGDGSLDKASMQIAFQSELERQLAKLDVRAKAELTGRQQLTVGERRIIGWSVRLTGLSEEHALRLQVSGLGGKRLMGCGVFVPTQEKQ